MLLQSNGTAAMGKGKNQCNGEVHQGWCQKFSDRGAGASDRGAKMTEKLCFRALFCQISSDKDPEFPPTGGLDASDGGGGCSPLALPWRQPWVHSVIHSKFFYINTNILYKYISSLSHDSAFRFSK